MITDSVTGMIIAAADAGDDAGDEQHVRRVREGGHQVGDREQREAGDEDRLAAPAVADRADRQSSAASAIV